MTAGLGGAGDGAGGAAEKELAAKPLESGLDLRAWLDAVPLDAVLRIAVVLVVAAAVVVLLRCWLLVRARRSRVRLRVVPSEKTEVSGEDVLRIGHLLARVRPVVSLVPRRAYPVRVLLRNVEGNLLAWEVHGPARAAGLLRSVGYPGTVLAVVPEDERVPEEPAARSLPVGAGGSLSSTGLPGANPPPPRTGETPPPGRVGETSPRPGARVPVGGRS